MAQAHGVPAACARAKLQGLLSYTLHKPRRRRFPTLPVVVHGMDDQWAADLVEMQPLKKWNRGMRYLSRRGQATPQIGHQRRAVCHG